MTTPTYFTHPKPAWGEKADFLVRAPVVGKAATYEQLWARQRDEITFEICCIPFFVYDIALGDEVETDNNYVVKRVVEPSGRFVFRIWFGDSFHPRSDIEAELLDLGAIVEWSSANLCAVDAMDSSHAQLIADSLVRFEDMGAVAYETGRSQSE